MNAVFHSSGTQFVLIDRLNKSVSGWESSSAQNFSIEHFIPEIPKFLALILSQAAQVFSMFLVY